MTSVPSPAVPPASVAPRSRLAAAALVLALAAAIAAALAGFGSQWQWWSFRTGFGVLRWATYGAIAAALLAVVAFVRVRPGVRRRRAGLAVLALVVALPVVAIPLLALRKARTVPPIHDITTDTDDPPQFIAVLPLRARAPNPPEYAGADVAAQQRAAYPDVRPVTLELPPAQAFVRALDAARDMGWEIVAADSAARRIEATATTFWFGFKDDVVVRLRPAGDGTTLDVRSKSRVGGSDVGANAARIRAYLQKVRG